MWEVIFHFVESLNRSEKWKKVEFALCLILLKVLFVCLFLERGEGKEKERERNVNVWEKYQSPLTHPQRGPGSQPKHVPWLGIQWPFGSWASTQSTKLHQPGLPDSLRLFLGLLTQTLLSGLLTQTKICIISSLALRASNHTISFSSIQRADHGTSQPPYLHKPKPISH